MGDLFIAQTVKLFSIEDATKSAAKPKLGPVGWIGIALGVGAAAIVVRSLMRGRR